MSTERRAEIMLSRRGSRTEEEKGQDTVMSEGENLHLGGDRRTGIVGLLDDMMIGGAILGRLVHRRGGMTIEEVSGPYRVMWRADKSGSYPPAPPPASYGDGPPAPTVCRIVLHSGNS